MEISKELAQEILDLLECDSKEFCTGCSMEDADCDERLTVAKRKLRDSIASAERNGNVSQETTQKKEGPLVEPDKASKYITIPVAEYHFLTKAATLLEIIMVDSPYSSNTVVAAVRTVVQEMVQHAEVGAAE